jgi:hypothetical protein
MNKFYDAVGEATPMPPTGQNPSTCYFLRQGQFGFHLIDKIEDAYQFTNLSLAKKVLEEQPKVYNKNGGLVEYSLYEYKNGFYVSLVVDSEGIPVQCKNPTSHGQYLQKPWVTIGAIGSINTAYGFTDFNTAKFVLESLGGEKVGEICCDNGVYCILLK